MNKKKNNIFLKILGMLFIIFMGLYIANLSGYYESKIRDKVIVTDEGIKEFEMRVKNGEEVDVTSFLNNKREDYSSSMSNLGDKFTSSLESLVEEGSKVVESIIKSLF